MTGRSGLRFNQLLLTLPFLAVGYLLASLQQPAPAAQSEPATDAALPRIIRASETPTEQFAEQVVQRMRDVAAEQKMEIRFLGPAPAPIAKLFGKFRFHALLQGEDINVLRAVARRSTENLKPPAGVQWVLDVDPMNLL